MYTPFKMRVSFVKAVNSLVSIFVDLHKGTWIMYKGKIHKVQYIKSFDFQLFDQITKKRSWNIEPV